MYIEYEAKFLNINKDDVRATLQMVGAVLLRSEFLQKRVTFFLPEGHEIAGGYARVRDEGDKITMSLKSFDGDKIENQKEICLTVDSFVQAEAFLVTLGCHQKSYQETKRELWILDDVEIMIDEWPFLEPFIEIEGASEQVVKNVADKLGFDYAKAIFGAVDVLYKQKYPSLTSDRINHHTPRIVFHESNPFVYRYVRKNADF